jgi:hypothetical protein
MGSPRKRRRQRLVRVELIDATPEQVAEVVLRVQPEGWQDRPTADLVEDEQPDAEKRHQRER